MNNPMIGLLVTADGTVVRGSGMGAPGVATGELVFQTSMVGYQEALTDPSYAGQILIFTYPLVGNYGVGATLDQSAHIQPRGTIVRDLMTSHVHRHADGDLDAMLRLQGVPALSGVDTRFLTRQVRDKGAVPASIAVGYEEELPTIKELSDRAGALLYDEIDFVADCSTPNLVWHPPTRPDAPKVALIDYGAKSAILNYMLQAQVGVWLVPASMPADEVLALQPDGVLLSNGPGDPAHLGYAVETVRSLMNRQRAPLFGICLGHQLLALAAGARTTKMRFGHRGTNQPVLDVKTGRVAITTQNHGYIVDAASLSPEYRVTHTNLNDGTVEGIAHVEKAVWGVQWHPEAHPGPMDTRWLIDEFLSICEVKHS
ncbi:MAG: glutamine-hydrolyzing carbamoyl-phosphate synthase small subunit [Chloroflexota bacterium]|nr:glutamine-hydrolyzing carbamoyl-phosphate synthase small subunit [Chloroflexota bacterium]